LTVLAGQSLVSQAEPGVLGFLVVAAIGLALVFLLRSMNKQLRKIGADRRYFSDRPGAPERPRAEAAPPQEHAGGDGQPS
jgi:hypothetical protein